VGSDVEAYWSNRFQAVSVPYQRISGMSFFIGSVRTRGCGLAVNPGPFYCFGDRTVYLDESFMSDEFKKIGDFAVAVIIAHEMGHHVQNLRRLDTEHTYTIEDELQADCLAGAWTASAGAKGLLQSGDLQLAARTFFSLADPTGTPWNDEEAHGSATLRIRAFTTGLQQQTACF
jgi:predicted metalloprotease